jgi:HK97 gp10 family phage protein
MTIRIKEDKDNKVTFAIIDDLGGNTEISLRHALIEIGQDGRREIRRLIRTGPKTGRTYAGHRASAPDEAPAERTGKLSKSISYRTRGVQQVTIGDTVDYGLWLEDGTRRMKPRPHVSKAIENKAKDTLQSFVSHTNRKVYSK